MSEETFLTRLKDCTDPRTKRYRPVGDRSTIVDRKDLLELIHHFERIDSILRGIHVNVLPSLDAVDIVVLSIEEELATQEGDDEPEGTLVLTFSLTFLRQFCGTLRSLSEAIRRRY